MRNEKFVRVIVWVVVVGMILSLAVGIAALISS